MSKINVRLIAESAIIAALYVALTWLFAPISYGAIQFRISEILVLLVLFKPKYSCALVLGCFISNITSSLGWWDICFGTLATLIALLIMIRIKNIYVSALMPVLSNSIIIAIELYLALNIEPIWLSMLTVGIGEFVVLYLIGIPIMVSISKNEGLMDTLQFNYSIITNKKIDSTTSLAFAAAGIGIVLFIALPCTESHTILDHVKDYYFLIWFAIFPVLYVVLYLVKKGIIRLVFTILISITPLFLFVFIKEKLLISFYLAYFVYVALMILLSVFDFKLKKTNLSEN